MLLASFALLVTPTLPVLLSEPHLSLPVVQALAFCDSLCKREAGAVIGLGVSSHLISFRCALPVGSFCLVEIGRQPSVLCFFSAALFPAAHFASFVQGLFVIGTQLHPTPRIENQLKGRAGRQVATRASPWRLLLPDGSSPLTFATLATLTLINRATRVLRRPSSRWRTKR